MAFAKFIRSKALWLNILLMIIVSVILILLLMWALTYYTRAGRTIIVPDLTGKTINQIEEQLENIELEYQVIDSIHKTDFVKGAIVEQTPRGGKNVKKGRKILLTINAYTSEMVVMPQLVDCSLRNAQVVLQTTGLVVGKITYKPSAYPDLVLGQLFEGQQIKAGTKIEKGSKVELIVGSGTGGNSVIVPELIGLTLEQAKSTLEAGLLHVGQTFFDETVTSSADSAIAVIYKQSPEALNGQMTTTESSVTMWLTKNNDLVIDALEEIENAKKNNM